MGWSDFFEGAMRSSAASLRGYMEAKVAVAQAKNARELQQAQIQFNRERNNILKQQQWLQHQLGMYTQKQQTERVGMQTQSAERVAQTGADAQVKSSRIGTRSAERVAETTAGAQVESTQIATEGQVESTKIGADAQRDIAAGKNETALKITELQGSQALALQQAQDEGELDRLIEQGQQALDQLEAAAEYDADAKIRLATAAADLEMRALFARQRLRAQQGEIVGLGAGYSFDHLKDSELRVQAHDAAYQMYKDFSGNKQVQRAQEIVVGHQLVQQGFNAKTAVGDLTMINSFQRMIDPGVSVREDDVKLLRVWAQDHFGLIEAGMSRLGLSWDNLTKEDMFDLFGLIRNEANGQYSGGRVKILSNRARQELLDMAKLLRSNTNEFVSGQRQSFDSFVSTHPLLRGSGFSFDNAFPVFSQIPGGEGAGATGAGGVGF